MTQTAEQTFDVALIGLGVGANYGSVLTYYSLYRTVESMGKSVLMVSKIGAKAGDPEIQDTHAMRFAKRTYNLSKVYNAETVTELNDLAHTFILGSDQVWNHGISKNFGKAFYFDFAAPGKRKLSYASSFGHIKDFRPPEEVPEISTLMQQFQAISVREDSGVDLARDIYNVPAVHVADPIFLLDRAGYEALAEGSEQDVSEPYLLAYILDPTEEKSRAIQHLADKQGLKVKVIVDGWPGLFAGNKKKMGTLSDAVVAGVETADFLKLYINASYVVTDSFHGTSFAIKFERPFAAIGNKRRGMARFDSIFRLVGDKKRFTLDAGKLVDEDARFLAPFDYGPVSARFADHVAFSRDWLQKALEVSPSQTLSLPPQRPADMAKGTAARMMHKGRGYLRRLIKPVRMTLPAPQFEANTDVWQITKDARTTGLSIAHPDRTKRGMYTWCTLPKRLEAGQAYALDLDWSLRTEAVSVNLHLRNPDTGKFRTIGTVEAKSGSGRDTVKFMAPPEGFHQVMLGAVHFTGPNAGADIRQIGIRQIPATQVPGGENQVKQRLFPAQVVSDLSKMDRERFLKFYGMNREPKNEGNARAIMMFYSHGLEKGLSRTTNFRPLFGQESLQKMAKQMNAWKAKDPKGEDAFYQIGCSVLQHYFARHARMGVDASDYRAYFDAAVLADVEAAEAEIGGAFAAAEGRAPALAGPSERSFKDVVLSRRSVREFIAKPVPNQMIEDCVALALQAPSVCNRQASRVHVIEDPAVMQAALKHQGGFGGYKMPPKLLLVTADLTAYIHAVERNQAYVDGGLFMMALLYALENAGLGACSLNTAMGREKDKAIRHILSLPENHVMISFIAVGYHDDDVLVPRSARMPAEEVVIYQPAKADTKPRTAAG